MKDEIDLLRKELSDWNAKLPPLQNRARMEELARTIGDKQDVMDRRFCARYMGFSPDPELRTLDLFVRVDKALEQKYLKYEGAALDAEQAEIEQMKTEAVEEEAAFLVMRGPDGKMIGEGKDLSFRGDTLYEGAKREAVKKKVHDLFGKEKSRVHLRLNGNGGLEVMDLGKRNASSVQVFRYSKLAAAIVHDYYTDVMKGVKAIDDGFKQKVEVPVEKSRALVPGMEAVLKVAEFADGQTDVRIVDVKPAGDMGDTGLVQESISVAKDDVERDFILRLDRAISQ